MTVNVSKPAFNIREKLSELDKPTGIKGTELMRSETSQEVRDLINSGRKNLIINGAMMIAQRGTSSTSAGYKTVDRFTSSMANVDEACTFEQADVAADTDPWNAGFRKSFKITNGNQTSGAGAADDLSIMHNIEAQNLANSGWDYNSSSSFITLSFWAKSSVAQTFYTGFRIYGSDQREYCFSYTLAANTWKKVTHAIPGGAGHTIVNNNAIGAFIQWPQWWGTNYTSSGRVLNSWQIKNNASNYPDNTSTWYTTNDATFELTGVQLEVGSIPTEFEHRSYAEELALCHRYFEKYTASGGNTGRGPQIGAYNGTRYFGYINCSPKRHSNLSLGFGGSLRVETINLASSTTVSGISDYAQINGGSGIFLEVNTSSWGSGGTLYHLSFPTNAYISIDSEL